MSTTCVECARIEAPVEGMTKVCREEGCHDVICLGHDSVHKARKHVVEHMCPDQMDGLIAFLEAETLEDVPEEFKRHLDSCEACQAGYEKLIDEDGLAQFVRGLLLELKRKS